MPLDKLDDFVNNLDPSSYGGIYYNKNHDLTINVVDKNLLSDNFKSSKFIKEVKIAKSTYSMNDLIEAKITLLKKSEELGISMIGFDGSKNSLVVFMNNLSDENQRRVIEASPVDHIVFKNNDFVTLDFTDKIEDIQDNGFSKTTTVYGGKRITNRMLTLTTSAVRNYGTSNQQLGFITAGHGIQLGQSAIYEGSFSLGSCVYRVEDSQMDVAFIQSSYHSHGYQTDNNGNTILVEYRRAPIAGDSIYMYGGYSSVRKVGTVTATGISRKLGDDPYQTIGLFSYNIIPVNGDSGAAIVSCSNDGTWSILGYNIAREGGSVGTAIGGLGIDIKKLEQSPYNILPTT